MISNNSVLKNECGMGKNSGDSQVTEIPSFSELINQNGKYIKAFIAKRIWIKDDIDDVYQITLMEAFKSYKNFRSESHPRTWVVGVASKIISNYIRKKLRTSQEVLKEDWSMEDDLDCSYESESLMFRNPEAQYELMQVAKNVSRVYERLPEEMRQVFESVIQNGQSYEEVSQLYGIPVGTVRSRLSRAREKMKVASSK